MTKKLQLDSDQENYVMKIFNEIKQNKGKLCTQLVSDFNKKYPKITVSYRQLNYIVTKRLKVKFLLILLDNKIFMFLL